PQPQPEPPQPQPEPPQPQPEPPQPQPEPPQPQPEPPQPQPEPPQPQPEPPIYNPTVPGYVQTAQANMEQGFAVLRTLHERRGENQTLAWDNCGTCGEHADGQTWGRLIGSHLDVQGKTRLGFDLDVYGVQIGHDFAIKRTDEGGHRLTGIYGAYSRGNTKFFDQYRAENGVVSGDKYTGKVKTDMWSLGLTHTRYAPNGSYVDLVGQLSHIHNKYQARNSVAQSQNGMSLVLSAEVGRPYALDDHTKHESGWLLEPQAQLIYQMVNLKDFQDSQGRKIEQPTLHGLRGRIGLRLAHNSQHSEQKLRTNTYYAVANIWHDFTDSKAVNIGSDSVRELYNRTWGEIGLGLQLPVGKQGYIYADTRYERNLSGSKREGYRGDIGYKYTWK
ncbi:autotransporter outer membrane beta-barrel domain-containing protein, partial [Conservatibacter flavescens]